MSHDAACTCPACDADRARARSGRKYLWCGEATDHGDQCPEYAARIAESRITTLAAAMRAVGAGRATLDGLSLDLTQGPLAAPAPAREPQRTLSEAEIKEKQEATLYAAGAGKKVILR